MRAAEGSGRGAQGGWGGDRGVEWGGVGGWRPGTDPGARGRACCAEPQALVAGNPWGTDMHVPAQGHRAPVNENLSAGGDALDANVSSPARAGHFKRLSLRGSQLALAARAARRHSVVDALEVAAAAAAHVRTADSVAIAAEVAADISPAGGLTQGQLVTRMSLHAAHEASRLVQEVEANAHAALELRVGLGEITQHAARSCRARARPLRIGGTFDTTAVGRSPAKGHTLADIDELAINVPGARARNEIATPSCGAQMRAGWRKRAHDRTTQRRRRGPLRFLATEEVTANADGRQQPQSQSFARASCPHEHNPDYACISRLRGRGDELPDPALLAALSRSGCERSTHERILIFNHLSSVLFFQKLAPAVTRELCDVASLVSVPQGRNVFEAGDEGTTFYVVLSGRARVSIVSQNPHIRLVRPRTPQTFSSIDTGDTGSSRGATNSEGHADTEHRPHTDTLVPRHFIACTLGPGDSFGELALMANDDARRKRAATVSATSEAPLLLVAIERHDYERMLVRSQRLEIGASRKSLIDACRPKRVHDCARVRTTSTSSNACAACGHHDVASSD